MPKGPEAFRTISEAAEELGVPQHVLRFWETKFSFIRPMKRAGGRRFYRPQDLTVLRGVQTLLHGEGYTIKGVQKLHKEQGIKRLLGAAAGEVPTVAPSGPSGAPSGGAADTRPDPRPASGPARRRLEDVLAELQVVKARLDRLL